MAISDQISAIRKTEIDNAPAAVRGKGTRRTLRFAEEEKRRRGRGVRS
jgi:hypothetical protein